MLERTRHTETVRVGAPVIRGVVTLLPIERVVLHSGRGSGRGHTRLWFSASKEPYALVVRDAGGLWAIDTDAVLVSLEGLRACVPGLAAALEAL